MEIHRPKAIHGWPELVKEIGVIVMGVLIALGAEQAVSSLHERSQSHEDRLRLIADLDVNRHDFISRQHYFQAVLTHAERALGALDQPASRDGEAFLIDAYQATQIAPRKAKQTTYNEIVSTGRLTRLGEPALRDRVGNFFVVLDVTGTIMDYVPPYRELLRRSMPGDIQITIRSRCPEHYDYLSDGSVFSTLAQHCTLGLDPQKVASAVSAVRAIPSLADELNRVVGDATSKLELIGVQLQSIHNLRVQLADADHS